MASENEKRETVVNVIAEYRNDADAMDRGELYQPPTEYLRRLLDRIESAWKREREELDKRISDLESYAKLWTGRADELRLKCDEFYAKAKHVGNEAAWKREIDNRLLAQPSINVDELRKGLEDISGSMREFAADVKECHDGIAPDVASYLSAGIREYATRLEFETERYLSEGPLEPVGNAAAMREALVMVWDAFTDGLITTDYEKDLSRFDTICEKVKSALATPPRNCNVGTAEEQTERFEHYCYVNRTNEHCCLDCPLVDEPSCEIAWAQMPYEAEEGASYGSK